MNIPRNLIGVTWFRDAATLNPVSPPWALVGVSAVSAVFFLVAGLAYFDRVERDFADLI